MVGNNTFCTSLPFLGFLLVCAQGHRRTSQIFQPKQALYNSYYIPVSSFKDNDTLDGEPYSITCKSHLQDDEYCNCVGDIDRGILVRHQILLASTTATTTKVRDRLRHQLFNNQDTDDTDEIILPSQTQIQQNTEFIPIENNPAAQEVDLIHAPRTRYIVSFPLLPKNVWDRCNGMEFYHADSRFALSQTGITMAKQLFRTATSILQRIPSPPIGKLDSSSSPSDEHDEIQIAWKPDSKTKQLFQEQQDSPASPILSDALQLHDSHGQEKEGHILVWIGQFQSKKGLLQQYHGGEFPIIRTTSIIPFSPKALAMLLLDSHRVKEYNKMSVGRTDEVLFQNHGQDDVFSIDTKSMNEVSCFTPSSLVKKTTPTLKMMGWNYQNRNNIQESANHPNPTTISPGQAKIVRNLTQPPLSNKLLEFITFMYARPLTIEDDVGPGYSSLTQSRRIATQIASSSHLQKVSLTKSLSSLHSTSPISQESSLGYIIVSRAVHGGSWTPINNKDGDSNHNRQRSEILLSVNLLRAVPGNPNQTEMTTVSHVNVPTVPLMVATPIGIKGSIDFVKDLRALSIHKGL